MDNKIFFTVEYPGAETKKSDFLNLIPKDKICLYFLRYGFFEQSQNLKREEQSKILNLETISKEKNKKWGIHNELEIIRFPELSSIENFNISRTFLNEGFLYLINNDPNADDAFIEVTVDELGALEYVVKKGNRNGFYEDQRSSITFLSRRYFLSVDKGSKYWIAYSPIQWSWAYLKEMLNNEKKRQERMQLVDCIGIPTNENVKPPKYSQSFKTINYTYHKEDEQRKNIFSKELEKIYLFDKDDVNKEVFEDMFITLNDPIGCARDISEGVCKKMLEFNACIQALQSGETFEAAFKRLSNGIFDIPEATTEEEIEYRQLFSLALTCYQLVYNDKSSIYKYDGGSPGMNFFDLHYFQEIEYYYSILEKGMVPKITPIGNGLSGQKLEGILGIKEREELRKTLLSYRNDFGIFLTQEKFLRKHLEDIIENHWERILIGKDAMSDILHCLSINPYDIERPLLLQKDYVKDEEWTIWFYKLLKDENNSNDTLKQLYNTAVTIDKPMSYKVDLSSSIQLYQKFFMYFASTYAVSGGTVFRSIREKKEFIVERLNRKTSFDLKVWEIVDKDIKLNMQKLGIEPDPKFVEMGKFNGSSNYVMRILRESEGVEVTVAEPNKTTNKNATVAMRVRKKTKIPAIVAHSNIFMAKVVNSKGFNTLFLTVEAFNFIFAMQEVRKDPNEKSVINVMYAGSKLGDVGMTLAKQIVKKEIVQKRIIRFPSVTFAALSAGLGVYITAMDTVDLKKKGDYDAAIAMGLSALAFAVAGYVSVGEALGLAALATGPIGWIAIFAALGFAFIASALTDTKMEMFFKNFILSDRKNFPKLASQTPMDYTRSFLNEKTMKEMVPDIENYREIMMYPSDAQATLFDMIVCGEIKFIPLDRSKIESSIYIHSIAATMIQTSVQEKATVFRADMVFNRFFSNPDLLEVKAFYYSEGMKQTVIPLNAEVKKVVKKEDSDNTLSVIFGLFDEGYNPIGKNAEILFVLRMCIDPKNNFYFPYPLKNKPKRYLGARVSLSAGSGIFYAGELAQNKKTKVDTLNNLKNPDIWK